MKMEIEIMKMTLEEVCAAVKELNEDDREFLLQKFLFEKDEISPEWVKEIENRYRLFHEGMSKFRSVDLAVNDLRKELKSGNSH